MTTKEKRGKQSEVMSTCDTEKQRQTLFRHTHAFMQIFTQKMVNNHGSKFAGEQCLRRKNFFPSNTAWVSISGQDSVTIDKNFRKIGPGQETLT